MSFLFYRRRGDSKNKAGDVDVEIYSLHYFITLACEGQMVALDMLHAPDSLIVESSDIWKSIVRERHRFYTKSLKAFISYARRQAGKYGIKGSRLNAAATVLGLLKAEDPSHTLRSIWNKLPLNEHCFETGIDPQGLRQYQVCGKQFQESAAIGYVAPVLEKFCEEYRQKGEACSGKQGYRLEGGLPRAEGRFSDKGNIDCGHNHLPAEGGPISAAGEGGEAGLSDRGCAGP